jgi:transposase
MDVFVGIDVSKYHLDVAVRPQGRAYRVGNDRAGVTQLVRRVLAARPRQVVLEASGGYELRLPTPWVRPAWP